MKIGKGVEWAAHACAVLALLPPGAALSRDALADYLGVPAPYLAKQLQGLSRAGLVVTQRGVSGGYRLSRDAEQISLWEITAALEGVAPSFRCTEIRKNGPCGATPHECPGPCDIAKAFYDAERVYRDALSAVPLTQVVAGATAVASDARKQRIRDWIADNATGFIQS
ncbi:MAG: Rrf2 family transcriptional regulator [Pseudomonadota bacterium]